MKWKKADVGARQLYIDVLNRYILLFKRNSLYDSKAFFNTWKVISRRSVPLPALLGTTVLACALKRQTASSHEPAVRDNWTRSSALFIINYCESVSHSVGLEHKIAKRMDCYIMETNKPLFQVQRGPTAGQRASVSRQPKWRHSCLPAGIAGKLLNTCGARAMVAGNYTLRMAELWPETTKRWLCCCGRKLLLAISGGFVNGSWQVFWPAKIIDKQVTNVNCC